MAKNLSERTVDFADTFQLDPFTRLRVSNGHSTFDSKKLFDKHPPLWVERLSGSGTAVHDPDRASVLMSVTASASDKVERRTRQYHNYQPGHGQLVMFTGIFGPHVAGVTKKYGLFDDENGFYFESNGSGIGIVRRTFVSGAAVNNLVAQASWNLDTVDGSQGAVNPSGVTCNIQNIQTMFIDFAWLGAGRVRYGIYVDGKPIAVHEVLTANVLQAVATTTPNLPIAAEIDNVTGVNTASMEIMAEAVISEGGADRDGVSTWISRPVASAIQGNSINIPIVSLRLLSGSEDASVFVRKISVINSSNNAVAEWAIYLNPTVAGVDAASWSTVGNTQVEFDISRDNTNLISGGHRVDGGFFASGRTDVNIEIGTIMAMGSDYTASDEWVLAVRTGGNDTIAGGIQIEQET